MNPFDELIKCRDDFLYFVDTYIKIKHPTRGLIPFKVHEYQKRLHNVYENEQFVIGNKFRQGGFTTFSAIWSLWKAMFFCDQRIMFLGRTDREAVHTGRIVQLALDHMPDWIKPRIDKCNDHEKRFPWTGSELTFWTHEAACSKSATHLFIDDAAFVRDMEANWQALYPVIATGGKAFIISTPNGVGNWFEETYNAALKGKNKFFVFKVDYTEHPDYKDPAWVKEMKKQLGERGFRSEVLGEFITNDTGKIPTDGTKIAADLAYFITSRELSEEDSTLFLKTMQRLRRLND